MLTTLTGEKLKEALKLYSNGTVGDKLLREKTQKDRRIFFNALETFFEKNGWVFSEEAARKFIEQKRTNKDGTPAKLSSIASYIAKLRAFNEFLVMRSYLQVNFCKWIAKPPESETLKPQIDLSDEVIMRAIKLGTNPGKGDRARSRRIKQESRAALMFMFSTSKRSGEFVKLTGADIHFEAEIPYYVVELKGGKRMQYPIPNNLFDMLRERQHKKRVFEVLPATTINHFREGLRRQGISEEIIALADNHALRKAFARERKRNGENIESIADAMGDTIETVKKYYLAHDMQSLKKTVNNARIVRNGMALESILDEMVQFVQMRAKDTRFQNLTIRREHNKMILEVPFSDIGVKEMKRQK